MIKMGKGICHLRYCAIPIEVFGISLQNSPLINMAITPDSTKF
jgi:hypothetical protein